ncbi:MAG: alpha/beta hydrolase [Oligoflexales bacterium]
MAKVVLFIVAIWIASCQTSAQLDVRREVTFNTVKKSILAEGGSIEMFSKAGSFRYKEMLNFQIPISPEDVLSTDLFLSQHDDYAPLLVIQHGNLADKSVHEYQARLAATWGFHVLVVSQTNEKRWIRNGHNLARLVSLLRSWPEILGSHFNPDQIILVGHSFGGSAVAIAAGSGEDVAGVIFLDPALYSPAVKKYLSNMKAPALLLGADPKVFMSRSRATFYALPDKIAEVSFRGATHNDAQYPSQFLWEELFMLVPKPVEERQRYFAAGIVLGSFAFASPKSNKLTFAWNALVKAKQKGIVATARKK